jgi:hypothetical protein
MNSRSSSRSRPRSSSAFAAAFAASASLVLAVACSSSEEAAPNRAVIPTPVPVDGGGSDDGASHADPSCTTDAGCFACEPSSLVDFLNACTEGQCAPFDNGRLPLYEPGKPLPVIP